MASIDEPQSLRRSPRHITARSSGIIRPYDLAKKGKSPSHLLTPKTRGVATPPDTDAASTFVEPPSSRRSLSPIAGSTDPAGVYGPGFNSDTPPIQKDVRPTGIRNLISEDPFAYAVPLPGSKKNKQIYPKAPISFDNWGQPEYEERFRFVKNELKSTVDQHPKLRDLAARISYELRMVGTTPADAIPRIIILCRCDAKDMKSLQSLFGRAQTKLHCGKGPLADRIFRKTKTKPIPPLQLVYFLANTGPGIRKGLDGFIRTSFNNTTTHCGGIAHYQGSSATLGVSIQINNMNTHLTVDHIFQVDQDPAPISPTHEEDVPMEDVESSLHSEDSSVDSPVLWENDDDEYEYGDQNEGDFERQALTTTHSVAPEVTNKHVEQWEKVVPLVELDPALPYLDWSLVRPTTQPLEIRHENVFFPNGVHFHPIFLDRVRDTTYVHFNLVKVISGIRGILLGQMLAGSSFLGAPPGQEDCEVLSVVLNSSVGLLDGECGSIVIDRETSEVYGHVIGCSPLGHALVVPLRNVFSQVKAGFGTTDVYLTPSSTAIRPRQSLPNPPSPPLGEGRLPRLTRLRVQDRLRDGSRIDVPIDRNRIDRVLCGVGEFCDLPPPTSVSKEGESETLESELKSMYGGNKKRLAERRRRRSRRQGTNDGPSGSGSRRARK